MIVCRKESQCRLEVGHWGSCAPEKIDFRKITDGPIYTPYGPDSEKRPFSTLVLSPTYRDAHGLALEVGLRVNEYFAAYPGAEMRWFTFDKAYVDLRLAPELRTDNENKWWATEVVFRLVPNAPVIYVDY